MSGTFFGFNTALRGLFAQQTAMNTTAHNIANANTPGFTRQSAIFATTPAFSVPSLNKPGGAGQIGTGITVAEIRRVRDMFLDKQIRTETQSLGKYSTEWEWLSQIETIFMEPSDTGLSTVLDEFWNYWNELSKNAENSPIRTTVKEASITLADTLNNLAQQLDRIYEDINQVTAIRVEQINSIAQQISVLNKQIAAIQGAGDQPNDLRDQRDALMDELAQIIDYEYEELSNGMVNIKIKGVATPPTEEKVDLVAGLNYNTLSFTYTPGAKGTEALQITAGGITYDVACHNGQLQGLANTKASIQTYRDNLDKLAFTIAVEINALHESGYDLNNDLGEKYFILPDYTDYTDAALNIKLNDNIKNDESKIAAAKNPVENAAGERDNVGDGNNALAIYELSRTVLNSLNNSTVANFYKNTISALGVTANAAKTNETNQQALVDQLTNRRESISGVSIDEEVANMLQYQRSYEAAAKIMTTFDEMIQTILELKR